MKAILGDLSDLEILLLKSAFKLDLKCSISGEQTECAARGERLPAPPAQTVDPGPGGHRGAQTGDPGPGGHSRHHPQHLQQLGHPAWLSSAQLDLCAGQPGQVNIAN